MISPPCWGERRGKAGEVPGQRRIRTPPGGVTGTRDSHRLPSVSKVDEHTHWGRLVRGVDDARFHRRRDLGISDAGSRPLRRAEGEAGRPLALRDTRW